MAPDNFDQFLEVGPTMSKYAIIQSGGRQYRVEEGQELVVEQGPGLKDGDPVQFGQVLLIRDEKGEEVGTPYVAGAQVTGRVVSSFKGEKILGYKYKPKKRYRRRWGYRPQLTKLLIQEIRRLSRSRSTETKKGVFKRLCVAVRPSRAYLRKRHWPTPVSRSCLGRLPAASGAISS